ncbi:hypothetical protein GCM10027072_62890 [Streptomyces bullii]
MSLLFPGGCRRADATGRPEEPSAFPPAFPSAFLRADRRFAAWAALRISARVIRGSPPAGARPSWPRLGREGLSPLGREGPLR